jgi:hypothetical protein
MADGHLTDASQMQDFAFPPICTGLGGKIIFRWDAEEGKGQEGGSGETCALAFTRP